MAGDSIERLLSEIGQLLAEDNAYPLDGLALKVTSVPQLIVPPPLTVPPPEAETLASIA